MVSPSQRRASWQIVPFHGDTAFKRVRVRDNEQAEAVLRHILAQQCVALVGPANSEKSHLLADVMDDLRRTGRFLPVYVDLWQAASSDESAFFSSLAALIAGEVPGAPPLQEPVTTARSLQNYLNACTVAADRHVALFVDHLQALPHDLVHAMLLALRAAYMEQAVDAPTRMTAVVTGGMNLVGFSAAPTSPFNIARPVLVGPLDREQSLALARASLGAWGYGASPGALERISEWAGGDHYLIPWLSHQCAQLVAGRRARQVIRTQVDRVIGGIAGRMQTLVPFGEAIRMVEEDPDTLLDALAILETGALARRQAHQVITRTGLDRLQLSGGFVLADGQYRVKNEGYRQALTQHFSTERVAHILRIAGRWQEAIDYLSPRLAGVAGRSARPQLLEAIVQSIYAADSSEAAFELLARGLRLGFELPDIRVYRADLPRHTLQRIYPVPTLPESPERLDLQDPTTVEGQTFLYGGYALRGKGTDARLVAALSTPVRTIGVVTVEHYLRENRARAIPDDLPDLLRFLLHAAGAIENVLGRVAYRKIGQAVLDAGTDAPTQTRVLEAVTDALGCDFAAIYLLDSEAEMLELSCAVGAEQLSAERTPVALTSNHPAARSLNERRPVLMRSADERLVGPISGGNVMRNPVLAHVPLLASGQALGVLMLGYSGGHAAPPGPATMTHLTGLADQVAIAVHNVGLLRRTESARARRVAELDKLRLSSLAVSSTLRLDESIGRIAASIQGLFEGAQVIAWEYTPQGDPAVILSTLPDLSDAATPSTQSPPPGSGQGRAFSIPLVSHDRAVGLLEVHLPGSAHEPLRSGEAELLEAFAAQAAVSIENARFRESESARERLERELALAREIQLSMLPGDFPDIPGWQFAAIYRAARVVSGDFYDHFLLPGRPQRLGVVIADVADKGVPAALFMALSRTIIRTTALSGRGPASALLRANELILKDTASDLFLTATYALMEVNGGRMIYANAGHNRPLLYRAAAKDVVELAGRGIMLGAFENISLEERRVDLAHGDALVLYTDGVTEARNQDGRFFEEVGLRQVINRHAVGSAAEIAAALDKSLRAFQGDAEQSDDVACIVVKRS